MLDHNKNSFFARAPFAQRSAYTLWLKCSLGLLCALLCGFAIISLKSYKRYQALIITKNGLLASAKELDEIVRKKNKLLAQEAGFTKHSGKALGVHAKIADYLKQIETSLVAGVQLNSFEYTTKKIEITGSSCDTQSLSHAIEKLHKLAFVKSHELQQVASNNGKLVFTIALNL